MSIDNVIYACKCAPVQLLPEHHPQQTPLQQRVAVDPAVVLLEQQRAVLARCLLQDLRAAGVVIAVRGEVVDLEKFGI